MAASQRRAVVAALANWRARGAGAVLATVLSSDTSAPRGIGAQLAVTDDGLWVGGISGGCAEIAVLDAARRLLSQHGEAADRAGLRLFMQHDTLGRVGPVCGAVLEVLVERVDDTLLAALQGAVDEARSGSGSMIRREYELVSRTGTGAEEVLELRRSSVRTEPWQSSASLPGANDSSPIRVSVGEDKVLLDERVIPPPRVVLGGAGDVAAELVALLGRIGWRTCLVDPRARFVDQLGLHASPDAVRVEWAVDAWGGLDVDASTACVALAHDDKLDLPFLRCALASDAFYVGLIGSQLVQRRRREQLGEGLTHEQVARLAGPAGLDLGGSSAAEIALSIAAELVASWHGRAGSTLTGSEGPIRAR